MRSRATKRAGSEMSKVLTHRRSCARWQPSSGMNPLPRFIAIVLFVVLAALVALLAMPVWSGLQNPERNSSLRQEAGSDPAASSGSAKARYLSQRAALALAATGLALTV